MSSSTDSIYTGGSPISTPLTLFLVQLIIVVTASRLLAYVFRYVKQPPVIAEVITGILLGPSAFGHIPNFTASIFPASSLSTFTVIANLGLILYMFIVGLEIDTRLMRQNWKQSVGISVTAMICPFLLGTASSYVIHQVASTNDVPFSSFLLFVGVALSITAFPVLARIIAEGKMLGTKVGSTALSSAAVDDVVAWCLLALVVSIARAKNNLTALYTVLVLTGFVVVMLVVMRPLLSRIASRRRASASVQLQVVIFLLGLIFVCAWFTEIIGVQAIFGAFVLGIVTPRRKKFAAKLTERIEDLVVVVLLPLYFTLSGLRTDITQLQGIKNWSLVLLVIATACVGKIGGATIAARFMKNSWRDSLTIGILMNTKGLVELIVLNIGLDVGVLNTQTFTIFVLMAVATTVMTTPLVWFVWERHQSKGFQKERKGDYSLLMYLSDPKVANWMGMVTSLFVTRPQEHVSVKALMLKEVSDRPSTYFFAEIYKDRDISLITEKRKNSGLIDLKTRMETIGVNFSSKTIISTNPPVDVGDYVGARDFNMVLFELKQQVEVSSISPSTKRLQQGLEKLEHVFDWEASTGKVISQAVINTECRLGILVNKSTSVGIARIEHILLIWQGKKSEATALRTAVDISNNFPEIQLHVVTHEPNFVAVNHLNPEKVSLHLISDESLDIDSAIQRREYDLILIGGERGSLDVYQSSLLVNCPYSILLLYNALSESGEPNEITV